MRTPQRLLARFRESEIAHLAFPDEIRHCADGFFHRHCGIYAMLVKEIDGVDPEPAQRFVRDTLHMLGTAVRPGQLSVFDAPAELRRDHHAIAPPAQSAAD